MKKKITLVILGTFIIISLIFLAGYSVWKQKGTKLNNQNNNETNNNLDELYNDTSKSMFILEAHTFVRAAETAYTEDSLSAGMATRCYTMQDLQDKSYLKEKKENYQGKTIISYDNNTKSFVTKIWIADNIFVFENSLEKDITKEKIGIFSSNNNYDFNCS